MQNDTLRNPETGRRRFLGAMSLLSLGLISALASLSPAALAATLTKKKTTIRATKTTARRTVTRGGRTSKAASSAGRSAGRSMTARVRRTWRARGGPTGPAPTTSFTENLTASDFDWNLSAKTVSLVTPTTGERLVHVPYWVNGEYQPDALADIVYLMRDLRTGEVRWIDPSLVDLLHGLQRTLGTREPFQVVCGYRSPETNAMLRRQSRRVASHSLHMQGKAVDIRLDSASAGSIQRAAVSLGRGGVGYYPRMGFVHVDTGSIRTWHG